MPSHPLPPGLHPDTLAQRVAMEPSQYGENSEALYLTSGYVQPSARAAAARFAGEEEGFTYGRYGNPTVASFEQRLYRMVPDFESVNANPKWIAWLNEVDPLLRAPRSSVAQQAFNRGDAEGVAHYVAMFKKSVAPVEPTADKTTELELQIQPNRSATSTPPTSQKGKVYTNADIEKMFRKATDLGIKGRSDEAKKLEAEIDAAFTEGRVTA